MTRVGVFPLANVRSCLTSFGDHGFPVLRVDFDISSPFSNCGVVNRSRWWPRTRKDRQSGVFDVSVGVPPCTALCFRHAALSAERVGRNIKTQRERAGLSLAQLSAATGISKAHLVRLEKRGGNPSLEILSRIAEALEVTIADLVGGPKLTYSAASDEDVPASLKAFANEVDLSEDEVQTLASIRFRGGERPRTSERWRFIYDSLSLRKVWTEMATKTWTEPLVIGLMAEAGTTDPRDAIEAYAEKLRREAEQDSLPIDVEMIASVKGVRHGGDPTNSLGGSTSRRTASWSWT